MARNQGGGWRLAGQLLGFGIAAGAAYFMHSKVEELIDQLLQKPRDEAFKELAGAIPSAEDEVWQIIHSALSRRAASSQRAAELLAIAVEARRMGPSVLKLIDAWSPDGSQLMARLASDLDEQQWALLSMMLAGMADREPRAGWLLRDGVQARETLSRARSRTSRSYIAGQRNDQKPRSRQERPEQDPLQRTIDSILRLPPQARLDALVVTAQSLSHAEWNALLGAMDTRARATPEAGRLLVVAKRLPDAIELADQLLAAGSDQAEQHLLSIATHTSEDDWAALSAVLSGRIDEDDEATQVLEQARAVHEAFYTVQELLQYSRERAVMRLERFVDNAGRAEWLRVVALLEQHAPLDRTARALLEKAKQIEGVRQPVNEQRLLAAPAPSTAQVEAAQQPIVPPALPTTQVEQADIGADMLRQSLRVALADRVITPEEAAMLEELRRKLNISDTLARSIFQEIRAEAV